jgi:pimeloyl-ACP methyl ester carboxylesterase
MKTKIILLVLSVALISSIAGFFTSQLLSKNNSELLTPFVALQENIGFPLLEYSIDNLKIRKYIPSNLTIESLITKENKYNSYVFSYITLGKKMTGQINIPDKITQSPIQKHSAIIMIRGYVPQEIYQTGTGTKNAADVLANNGYITIAPDFFGYGKSDPEPEDSWQTRFEKPIAIIELLESIKLNGVPTRPELSGNKIAEDSIQNEQKYKIDDIGIWAHSNGGQIALTTLEILDQEIPTTLWAPVTAPFPYSVLYFGDELEDEGKSQRKWISMFEEKYNAFDFSLTKHLNSLQGPIQIHHGNADDAALIYWSEEFVDKIEAENDKRAKILAEEAKEIKTIETTATNSGEPHELKNLEEIDLTFYKYEDTNHNMVPNWNKVIGRDIQFFNKYFNQ